MGFGILFIGYFMAMLMSINAVGSVIRLLGYALVLVATRKLSKYHRAFDAVSLATALMMAVSLLLVVYDASSFLYEQVIVDTQLLPPVFRTVVGYIEMALTFVFSAVLLWAIRLIAIQTDVHKIAVSAVRNFVFICVYYVLSLIGLLPFAFAQKYAAIVGAPVLILYFVWIILNIVLIYSCYARICDEDDVDMEQKPSRFEFVNNMRRESEKRREAANQKYAQKMRERKQKRK
jgi:hypothetical protein